MICPEPEGGIRVRKVVEDMIKAYERRNRRERVLWLLATLAVIALGGGVHAWIQARAHRLHLLTPGDLAEVSEETFAEGVDAGILSIGAPLPATPLEHWKRPPCSGRQKAINGACWVKLDGDPGDDHCAEMYEWDGACWAPVAKGRRAPQAIQR